MFDLNTPILVADDMGTMRKLVIKACQTLGFKNFTEAADGALAWEKLASANPAFGLVISDWNMPNCSGLDFLKRVRSDSRFKNLPFILVTAEAEAAQVVEAVKAGVSSYVIKPFNPETLAAKLQEAYKKTVK